MPNILILCHSSYGRIETMSQAVVEGATEIASLGELASYDAIIFGTPTRFGNMAAQMRSLLDLAGAVWVEGALIGKIDPALSSAGTTGEGEIVPKLCRLSGSSATPAKGGLAPWAARRCIAMMRERLSQDINLDDLSAAVKLSPFHFARMFKQSLGLPPRAYLTRLRLEKACELLETTDLSVTEIAFEVGYSTNQVLARVFLKHKGMSPTDYRRRVWSRSRSVLEH